MTSVVACPARSECQHSWRRPGALVIIFIAHVPCRARKARVKVVLGTDAVAGAHGRYAEEFIYRVQDGGDSPMDALLSGTSVAAESLGWRTGSVRWRRGRRRIWWPWMGTRSTTSTAGPAGSVRDENMEGCIRMHRRRIHSGHHDHRFRSEEHTSELQSPCNLVCRLLLEKKIPYVAGNFVSAPSGASIRPMKERWGGGARSGKSCKAGKSTFFFLADGSPLLFSLPPSTSLPH